MKKIGFIDCYLSNWHANNYPAWIRESCEERGLEYELAYAWAEVEVSPRDNKTTDQWCAENNVVRCNSIEEICEKSDVLFILAPTNPEKHLEYAKIALKYGKRTYIDKTFAPNYAEAALSPAPGMTPQQQKRPIPTHPSASGQFSPPL